MWHKMLIISKPAYSRYKASKRVSATCSECVLSTRQASESLLTSLDLLWLKPVQVCPYFFINIYLWLGVPFSNRAVNCCAQEPGFYQVPKGGEKYLTCVK